MFLVTWFSWQFSLCTLPSHSTRNPSPPWLIPSPSTSNSTQHAATPSQVSTEVLFPLLPLALSKSHYNGHSSTGSPTAPFRLGLACITPDFPCMVCSACHLLGLLSDPKDKDIFLQNVRLYPNCKALQPRRPHTSYEKQLAVA
jgi:hypothetical protein